jgi:hypothetical protein
MLGFLTKQAGEDINSELEISYATHQSSCGCFFPLSTLIALPSAQAQEQGNTWSGAIFKSPNP